MKKYFFHIRIESGWFKKTESIIYLMNFQGCFTVQLSRFLFDFLTENPLFFLPLQFVFFTVSARFILSDFFLLVNTFLKLFLTLSFLRFLCQRMTSYQTICALSTTFYTFFKHNFSSCYCSEGYKCIQSD